MNHMRIRSGPGGRRGRPARAAAAWVPLAAALLLAGCAGSRLVAQWNDPQFSGQPPRGAKVMVSCQAPEPTLRRLCVDRLTDQLLAQGVHPVPAPDIDGAALDEAVLRQAARATDAAALLRGSLTPEAVAVAPAPSIGFGIGGFGGGYRSGGGVGIGVSAPLGAGGPAETGFTMSAALSDTASGQLMWSGRASAAPSSDVNRQLATMAAQLFEGARESGLFAR